MNQRNDARMPEFHQILKDAGFHTVVVPLHDDVVRDVKNTLYLLWGRTKGLFRIKKFLVIWVKMLKERVGLIHRGVLLVQCST